MQFLYYGLYIGFVIILQTTVLARINIAGVTPDLVLPSVIVFSILNSGKRSVIFAGVFGFVQDIFSFGLYINMIMKVIISNLVDLTKESFVGNDFMLALILVAVFTPGSLLVEAWILKMVVAKQVLLVPLAVKIFWSTLYNLLIIPIIFPILNKIKHV